MKTVVIAVLLVSSVFFGCKKSEHRKSEYPFVYLHQSINKSFGNEQVRLKFDEVLSDSRCAVNAFCIWEGAAVVKFTFTVKEDHQLTLSTNPLNLPYAKDTTVEGYKIAFIDLQPHPVLGQTPPPASQIRAEIAITR
jgi:hypothetical protein